MFIIDWALDLAWEGTSEISTWPSQLDVISRCPAAVAKLRVVVVQPRLLELQLLEADALNDLVLVAGPVIKPFYRPRLKPEALRGASERQQNTILRSRQTIIIFDAIFGII